MGLFLFTTPPRSHAALPAVVAALGKAGLAAKKIFIWASRIKMVASFFEKETGRVDKASFDAQIDALISKDQQHAAELRALKAAVNDRMTRAEVEAKFMDFLKTINPKLEEMAQDIRTLQIQAEEQRQRSELHQALITELQKDQEILRDMQEAQRREYLRELEKQRQEYTQGLERQSDRTDRIESGLSSQMQRTINLQQAFEALRKDYPRWDPNKQATQLAVAGMRSLVQRDNKEALRAFRFAHAFDPTDPGVLYGLAVATKRAGNREFAEMLLAKGIVAERRRSLKSIVWWKYAGERFQGQDRLWVEDARVDAVYGVFVPGVIAVPETTRAK